MPETPTKNKAKVSFALGATVVAVFVIWMIAVTVWYFYYDFPSGVPTLGTFVAIFFREIITFLFVLAAFILFVVEKISQTRQRDT